MQRAYLKPTVLFHTHTHWRVRWEIGILPPHQTPSSNRRISQTQTLFASKRQWSAPNLFTLLAARFTGFSSHLDLPPLLSATFSHICERRDRVRCEFSALALNTVYMWEFSHIFITLANRVHCVSVCLYSCLRIVKLESLGAAKTSLAATIVSVARCQPVPAMDTQLNIETPFY